MKDMIIKGTGNSRYLKSVSNFLSLYPTYESFVSALVAGTLPIDLNGTNSAGITQEGTPLTKANLLSDNTAALAGLTGETATMNNAVATGLAMPRYNFSGDLTLALEHAGHFLYTGGPSVVTIPTHANVAFPLGTEIKIGINLGTLTIVPASGVTIRTTGGLYADYSAGYEVARQNSVATLKYLTGDVWILEAMSQDMYDALVSLILAST